MMKIFIFSIILSFSFNLEAKVHPEIQYLFPLPNTEFHAKETQLIIRFREIHPDQVENLNTFIKMSGEKSGEIEGKSFISSDNKTIVFKPRLDFIPGEKVYVELKPHLQGVENKKIDAKYYFKISPTPERLQIDSHIEDRVDDFSGIEKSLGTEVISLSPVIQNGISFPTDFPWTEVYINDNPDTGNIFLCTYIRPFYSMILDHAGNPIWYHKTSDRRRDLKVQKNGLMTMLVQRGFDGGSHIAMDSSYAVVDTFYSPPGYSTDEHELQVLSNGHYFVLAYDFRYVDMRDTVDGGRENAYVQGNVVAEMDADDNCIFLWRSFDYFDITDAIYQDLTGSYIESTHMNAIEIDHDEHILISSRSLSEVTKIHRYTGEIIWRLGGQNNQFEWVNDEHQIAAQHDIRVLPNGNYTLFDNGNHHVPYFSRALEFELDTLNMTVTKVWEFAEDPLTYSRYMGNTQRLPNGNTLINWAVYNKPKLTEVRPDGSKAFEMDFQNGYDCYRTFRYPWKGKAIVPYLVIESWDDRVSLLFNKFGDTDVDHYNIYGGLEPNPEEILVTTIDPLVHLRDLTNHTTYYFRVTAVDDEGIESGFSNQEQVYVNISEVGQDIVYNGDFSNGFVNWNWSLDTSTAAAQWSIDSSKTLQIQITEGGSDFSHVRVYYPNIQLIEGREYLFEYDSYADENRVIEADIMKLIAPFTKYSKIGYTFISSTNTHFAHTFKMEYMTEFSAAIVFNVGNSEHDVYIDNVSLKELITANLDDEENIPTKFSLDKNYPNPFNPTTTISYSIPQLCHVKLTIYNILGERVEELVDLAQNPGQYEIKYDSTELSSGLYFYELRAKGARNSTTYYDVKKMMVIK